MIDSARTWTLLRELRRGTRVPLAEIERRQARLLAAALAHAREKVPLYRRAWEGLPLELQRLPLLTREQVREGLRSGELVAEGADAPEAFPSSGTAGQPVEVPRGAVEARLWRSVALRTWFEHGHRWHDRTVHFDAHPAPSHPLQRLGISRTAWISPGLEDEELLARFAAAAPDFVAGTPTVLRRLCRAIEASGQRPSQPRTVLAEGEVLDAGTSALIERALGVAPLDHYGLTETGYVGWQCEQREHLHVNAEVCIVELVVDGRTAEPGELGSVVVTQLRARTAPMIRYDTGDLARAVEGPCRCGRTLPLMGRVAGRAAESIGDMTTRDLMDGQAPALPDEYVLHRRPGGGYDVEPRNGAAPATKTRIVA